MLNKVDNVLLVYALAIDADALTKIYKVRRSIKSDLVTCRLKNCCQGMRARTFSVGTCYMNSLELAMRMAEMAVKLLRIEQALLISRSPHLFKDGGRIEQIFYRFLIIHFCKINSSAIS